MLLDEDAWWDADVMLILLLEGVWIDWLELECELWLIVKEFGVPVLERRYGVADGHLEVSTSSAVDGVTFCTSLFVVVEEIS